eukprot:PhF_6_TR858/c0_g1_i1/m.1295
MDAEQQIAELLDEIDFLERQLKEKDDTLKEAKVTSTNRENLFAEGLEAMIGYVTAVEQGILLPALNEFAFFVTKNATRQHAINKVNNITSSTSQFPRLSHLLTFLQVPNTIADTLMVRNVENLWERPHVQPDEAYIALCMLVSQREQLEQLMNRVNTKMSDLAGIPLPSSGPLIARALSEAQHERAVALQKVAQIEERLSADKLAVSSSLEALKHALCQSTDECRSLRDENSRLLEELNSLRRSVSSSKPLSSTAQGGSVQTEYQTKLAAFEMTVAALNDELGGVETRIGSMERRHESQKKVLQEELENMRRQYDEERRECDAFVQKMMQEMELLWKENEELRRNRSLSPRSRRLR